MTIDQFEDNLVELWEKQDNIQADVVEMERLDMIKKLYDAGKISAYRITYLISKARPSYAQ